MKNIYLILLIIATGAVKAQDKYRSQATGNWNDISTWEIGTGTTTIFIPGFGFVDVPTYGPATSVPTSNDLVDIVDGNTVTVNTNQAASNIAISSSNSSTPAKLIINSGNSLTTSDINLSSASSGLCELENNGTFNTTNTIVYVSNSLGITNIINNGAYITATTQIIESNNGKVNILNNSSALYSTGNISVSNSNASNTIINLSSGNGTLELTGNITGNNLTLNAGILGSIVDYSGTSAQTIETSKYIYNNLHVSNTSGASLDAPISALNVTGELTTNAGGILNQNGHNITLLNDLTNDGTINANANLDLSGDYNSTGSFVSSGSRINIEGDWNNAGTYTYAAGDSVVFDGTVTGSTITGGTIFDELVINQTGLTTNVSSGTVGIASYLNVTSGTLNASGAATVTLLSAGNNTGQLLELGAGADYTGDLQVQRDLSVGSDGWREITSPVAGTTLANWQDDGLVFTGFTGADYDASSWYGWISSYTYTEANAAGVKDNGWVASTNTTNPTSFTKGHRIYTGSTTTGTLEVKGAPNKDAQSVTGLTNSGSDLTQDGWHLIGNPYPCTIDWNSLDITNLENAYWIWNATAANYGLYSGGAASGINGVDNEIAHSQAFWVHATSSGASVAFNESDKVRSDKAFVKSNSSEDFVRIKLSSAVNSFYDEAIIVFNDHATENYDTGIDMPKLYTSMPDQAPSLSIITTDAANLSIAGINELQSRSIPLEATAGTAAYGTYTIDFTLPATSLLNSCVTLEDLETGTITDLKTTSTYTFTTSASSPQTRFIIHITNPYETATFAPTCYNQTDGIVTLEGANVNGYTFTIANAGGILETVVATSNEINFYNLPSDDYTITSSQNNICGNNTVEVTIIEPQEVVAEFDITDPVLYLDLNATITPQNNSNGTTYAWDFGDGNTSIDANPTHTYTNPGLYTITLTAEANGCSVTTTETVEVKATTAIDELSGVGYTVISNENNITVTLEETVNNGVINLISINGKLIYSSSLEGTSTIINTNEYAKGIYLITIASEGKQNTKKVVIK